MPLSEEKKKEFWICLRWRDYMVTMSWLSSAGQFSNISKFEISNGLFYILCTPMARKSCLTITRGKDSSLKKTCIFELKSLSQSQVPFPWSWRWPFLGLFELLKDFFVTTYTLIGIFCYSRAIYYDFYSLFRVFKYHKGWRFVSVGLNYLFLTVRLEGTLVRIALV